MDRILASDAALIPLDELTGLLHSGEQVTFDAVLVTLKRPLPESGSQVEIGHEYQMRISFQPPTHTKFPLTVFVTPVS